MAWCLVARSGWDCGLPAGPQAVQASQQLRGCVCTFVRWVCGWASRAGLLSCWPGERACSPAPPGPQVWSITYHSWLTFVLLLWACLIWTVRSRHQLAMLCSPFILLYGLALCCLRYVWAMDLRPELPTALGPVSLRQLGLEHTRYPCLDLGAMVSPPGPPPAPSVVGVLQPRACVWVSGCVGVWVSPGPLAKPSIVAQSVFVE